MLLTRWKLFCQPNMMHGCGSYWRGENKLRRDSKTASVVVVVVEAADFLFPSWSKLAPPCKLADSGQTIDRFTCTSCLRIGQQKNLCLHTHTHTLCIFEAKRIGSISPLTSAATDGFDTSPSPEESGYWLNRPSPSTYIYTQVWTIYHTLTHTHKYVPSLLVLKLMLLGWLLQDQSAWLDWLTGDYIY